MCPVGCQEVLGIGTTPADNSAPLAQPARLSDCRDEMLRGGSRVLGGLKEANCSHTPSVPNLSESPARKAMARSRRDAWLWAACLCMQGRGRAPVGFETVRLPSTLQQKPQCSTGAFNYSSSSANYHSVTFVICITPQCIISSSLRSL